VRQVVLDTETTGLSPEAGHRVIEIGCVELEDRLHSGRTLHHFINPDREIDPGAQDVHGITNEQLVDKPRFSEVAAELREFIAGAQLIIHNAPFDLAFLDAEYRRLDPGHAAVREWGGVLDTLLLARERYPGQANSLDALCKRLGVDNSGREYHGALLDAQLLADVYLAMTGGQVALTLEARKAARGPRPAVGAGAQRGPLPRVAVSAAEREAHRQRLDAIRESAGRCLWDEFAASSRAGTEQRD